jgi:hypothetical protein
MGVSKVATTVPVMLLRVRFKVTDVRRTVQSSQEHYRPSPSEDPVQVPPRDHLVRVRGLNNVRGRILGIVSRLHPRPVEQPGTLAVPYVLASHVEGC